MQTTVRRETATKTLAKVSFRIVISELAALPGPGRGPELHRLLEQQLMHVYPSHPGLHGVVLSEKQLRVIIGPLESPGIVTLATCITEKIKRESHALIHRERV